MIQFNKFPDIVLRGKKVIWDSRQSQSGAPERVYISTEASQDLRAKFVARNNVAEKIEEPQLLSLGKDVSEALGFPSRKLKIVGVTGTNGKTSSTHIMSYVLASQGHRVLQIGTLGIQIWEQDPSVSGSARIVFSAETGFTTPEAPSLHDLFQQAVDAAVSHVVMEVSSHALQIGRVSGIEFDVGLFTNLSQDHLDFHKTMEAYASAKRLFFERELAESSKKRKFAIIGVPDETSEKIFLAPLKTVVGIERHELRRGKTFEVVSSSLEGLKVSVGAEGSFRSHLIGIHNAWNLSLCFCALHLLEGVTTSEFESILEKYPGIPGRFERVGDYCFVDYAHTPDALEKVLSTLRSEIRRDEKLVVVFGCGGDRDRTKRPQMGRIAGRIADTVIITSDNPRTEDPQSIIDQIFEGVDAGDRHKVRVCWDRAEAIRRAVKESGPEDVIAVCGKGHEDYQIIGTTKFPFSDQDCIRKCLQASADSSH
ncbi:MAG: UDP-N-acetylmuramoyl-L-alanyl-D-glutamate--2,6-diaminopimelate ligase [Bdellovibrionota bacterium]